MLHIRSGIVRIEGNSVPLHKAVASKRYNYAQRSVQSTVVETHPSFADLYSYAFSDIVHLSLPISQILASFTVILPIATGASLYSVRRLLRVHAANLGRTRPTVYLILLLAFQLMYETVVATLSLTYMAPASSLSCGLEEQWKRLYMSKDGAAVRRIQDRFDCCGFNSLRDRAWPFPHDHLGPEQCQARFDRTRSCAGPWRQAEQINAGLFLTVAAITFAIKVCCLCSYL